MKRYTLSIRNDTDLIDKAKLFFEKQRRSQFTGNFTGSNIRPFADEREIKWDKAFTIWMPGHRGIVIPLVESRPDNFSYSQEIRLLVSLNYKEEFNAELVRLVPDHEIGGKSFTGSLAPANAVHCALRAIPLKVSKDRLHFGPPVSSEDITQAPEDMQETEPTPEETFSVASAHDRIANIMDYFSCFTVDSQSKDDLYEVMLCVCQPEPGTREKWRVSKNHAEEEGNPVFVGHTFLVMKQKKGNYKIVRNVGFYPTSMVWPYQAECQGCLNNDSYADFNIGLNITVSWQTFAQILMYAMKGNDKGFNYNLFSNNCTTFALDALAAGGISLPRTLGLWHNGKGLDPGDLGEDIRTLKLSSNMKLITSYQAHGTIGGC